MAEVFIKGSFRSRIPQWSRMAAAPAAWAAAAEVPDLCTKLERRPAPVILTPGAASSGFIWPDRLNPLLEWM